RAVPQRAIGLRGLDALAVGVDGLLPRRAPGAARAVREEVRVRLQHLLRRAGVEDMGHEDVGDGEVVGRDVQDPQVARVAARDLVHAGEAVKLEHGRRLARSRELPSRPRTCAIWCEFVNSFALLDTRFIVGGSCATYHPRGPMRTVRNELISIR